MITIIIAGLIAIILFMAWKFEREKVTVYPKDLVRKIPIWLVIGLLSIFVLFFPGIRNKIHELQRKNNL